MSIFLFPAKTHILQKFSSLFLNLSDKIKQKFDVYFYNLVIFTIIINNERTRRLMTEFDALINLLFEK